MSSIKFKNVFIEDYYSLVGPMERNSRLKYFDANMNDYYYQEKTFELAEVRMQRVVIDNILSRNNYSINNIDILIGGDLLNQISATSYNARDYDIPFLGLYSACSTFTESLIVASNLIDSNGFNKALVVTSSHNLTAEKQYRYPVEYGSPKKKTSTFTATGAVSAIVTTTTGKLKIEAATIGRAVEMGINDANNLGAVMAPAAASTLQRHLIELERTADYYDLILTGDLGCIGANIFKEFIKRNYNIVLKNHLDAGCELFLKSQDTYAGGSGPVCLPLVLFNRILKQKKYKKILLIATGSLHSPAMVNQKQSIPAIAHAVSVEVL